MHTEAPRGSFKVVLQSCSSFGLMPTAPSCPTELQYLHLPLLGVSHTFEGGGAQWANRWGQAQIKESTNIDLFQQQIITIRSCPKQF